MHIINIFKDKKYPYYFWISENIQNTHIILGYLPGHPWCFESLPKFITGRLILENFGSMKVTDILAFPQEFHRKNIIGSFEELDSWS